MPSNHELQKASFRFYKDDRGFYYLRLAEGEELKIDDILAIQAHVVEAYKSEALPWLIELAYGVTVQEGLEEYVSKGTNTYSRGNAILISTFAHKLMTKFYLRRYKPDRPTKVFGDVFEALDWIEKQK